MDKEIEAKLKELEVRVKELELGSELAKMGMTSGATGVGLVFVSVMTTLAAALYARLKTGEEFITGTQFVFLTTILVICLVLYFAFVFRRDAQIVAELAKGKFSATTGGAPKRCEEG